MTSLAKCLTSNIISCRWSEAGTSRTCTAKRRNISAPVADCFKRIKLVANQVIEKALADGGLFMFTKVAHINQMLTIVRDWLLNVRVISPASFQVALEWN